MSAILEGVTLNGSSTISSSSSLPKKKGAATPAAPKPNSAALPGLANAKSLAPPNNLLNKPFLTPISCAALKDPGAAPAPANLPRPSLPSKVAF